MKTKITLLTLLLAGVFGLAVQAQNARIQVIHNCPDSQAGNVDVWINNTALLPNVGYRTASPFQNAPAGVPLEIRIKPAGSTDTLNPLFFTTVSLDTNETYVIIADGIINPTNYSPAPPFGLKIFAGAREIAANGMMETDVLVYHGSTDAPTVDVYESSVPAGTLVDDIPYGLFSSGYLELNTADYELEIRNEQNSAIVASFEADLATRNLGGAAITVLASGFLDPSVNNNGPAFGLFAVPATGGMFIPLNASPIPTARVQVIHNSADLAASKVDVWLNDGVLANDFAFRTATGFVDAQAGVPFDVSIADSMSVDTAGAIAKFTYTLDEGETYILVANGIVNVANYSPATPFDIYVYNMGRENSANGSSETDVVVFHGATDAPTVDVYESSVPAGTLVDDIAYSEFQGYLELGTQDYELEVRNEQNSAIVAAFEANLSNLNLGGEAITVLASGFLDPSVNNNGPAFGLWAATSAGGPLVELDPAMIPMARVQVIHNAADDDAATVDVWLNDGLLENDFAFRNATGFVNAQAGVPFDVTISDANSTDTTNSVARFTYTLDEGETYILVANGIVDPTNYSPNQPFDIYVYSGAREVAVDPNQVDLLVFHGATDAPTVDVVEKAIPLGAAVTNLSYSDFDGYLSLDSLDYSLAIEAGGAEVRRYVAPLDALDLDGAALTVLASGFLDPSVNDNGPAFGLWVATEAGGALLELPNITSAQELAPSLTSLNLFPNPSNGDMTLRLETAQSSNIEIQVMDVTGQLQYVFNAGDQPAGLYQQDLQLSNLSAGIYLMTIRTGDETSTRRIQILR